MPKQPFIERLQESRPILADGAMGTLLHQRGHLPMNACFDLLNLDQPHLVLGTHRDYIAAGADLIETNTFGANRIKLAEHGCGDPNQVTAINTAAVHLAQQAIRESGRDDVYIGGSVGPLGVRIKPYGTLTRAEAKAVFAEQIAALVAAGVDAIILETFAYHDELLIAVEAARQTAPDVPIIAQATFANDNLTVNGLPPARVAHELYKSGAHVIGVNCSGGPSHLSDILQTMRAAVPNARLSVMPNAGFPETIGGRAMYPATADYFGDYALTFKAIGATIIGGCCGTTAAHIAAMRAALDDTTRPLPIIRFLDQAPEMLEIAPQEPTELAKRLMDGRFTITVEMTPPRSVNADKVLSRARLLRDAGADLLNVADTPAAKMKMSAWAVCHLLHTIVGIETVLHFPTRGRNLLRVQGDLLAAHALDLRNLFVVMGDPARIGDYPDATDSYDIVPSKLISLITQQMNHGQDLAGNSIGQPTHFFVGCALNMAADDIDNEIKVLRNKLAAGANFALGQAVFHPERIEQFHRRYQELEGKPLDLPVLLGVIPLYSLKHAQFLHNEVPGITIPDSIFKRLEDAGDRAPQEGVKIAQELMAQMRGMVQGAYVIPAYGQYELAAEVVDYIARGVPIVG